MARTPGFGVDVGGSGIKGCTVDLRSGSLDDERIRILTPQPATPVAVAEVVATLTGEFGRRRAAVRPPTTGRWHAGRT